MLIETSSTVEAVIFSATGGSFTESTVMVTVAGADSRFPSETIYSKLSVP